MIENGNKVKVHYTGKLEDGKEFDSSLQREPLEFVVGTGQLIEGFETGVIGLAKGDKKTLTIAPESGYGPVVESMVVHVPRSNVPPDVQVGSQLQADGENGQPMVFVVREVNEDNIIIDGNHPLAGKTLTFDVEIVDVL